MSNVHSNTHEPLAAANSDAARLPIPNKPVAARRRDASASWIEPLQHEIGRVLVGQKELVDGLLISLLSGGHVLLEGVPGLAKTLALKTLARALHGSFARIQFTPDMLPSDVVGTLIYNPREGSFETKHGPVFANFVLADEINRAPAKVQSALLESMQEHQVTIGDATHPLPRPFMVMATQNPLEQEGTYPLPEAQLDRFMFKLLVSYPSNAEELRIVASMASTAPKLEVAPLVTMTEVCASRAAVDDVYVDDRIVQYIVSLVDSTRHPARYGLELSRLIRCGASPRASIALALASKARAYMQGRDYVTPQDVKVLAPYVLRHRIVVTYEAEAQRLDSEHIINSALDQLPIP
ncbi:MAG TPA: MoxR family ATPase [Polyangiales bacterium]|nr:MoxR family ATPase [Polyangiales bacterium]